MSCLLYQQVTEASRCESGFGIVNILIENNGVPPGALNNFQVCSLAFLPWKCHWVFLNEAEQIQVLMGQMGMRHLARCHLLAETILHLLGLQQERLGVQLCVVAVLDLDCQLGLGCIS